jgi:hypothetical protein
MSVESYGIMVCLVASRGIKGLFPKGLGRLKKFKGTR